MRKRSIRCWRCRRRPRRKKAHATNTAPSCFLHRRLRCRPRKSQRCVEGVRCRVRRAPVDFAKYALMPGANGMFEQIFIELSRIAAASSRRCHHDPVHIDKVLVAGAKPLEIWTVVFGVLIQRQQKGVEVSDPSRHEGLAHEMLQPLRLKPGQLCSIGVVERQQRPAERLTCRCIRGSDEQWFTIGHAIHPTSAMVTRPQKNTRGPSQVFPRTDAPRIANSFTASMTPVVGALSDGSNSSVSER
jgi:hypothetical protein